VRPSLVSPVRPELDGERDRSLDAGADVTGPGENCSPKCASPGPREYLTVLCPHVGHKRGKDRPPGQNNRGDQTIRWRPVGDPTQTGDAFAESLWSAEQVYQAPTPHEASTKS
jgi:hypothetical protein